MGYVFKARQPHLDRLVALKLLPDKLARDPRFAERFGREGRVLARLNHPNIVSVYDFGQTEHFYFLLMEFVDGVNLRQAMKAGRFSPAEALAIVPKICEALQYAHSQGVLHRDIKPENILLDTRGQLKIADFGIAKLVGEEQADVTLTATGASLGTPHYMAPEQLEKPAEVDHRADIYSLGVVFYEMLTGELPIGRFAPPSSKTPVGANVDEVVFRTLEKDRERRYQSAGEMKTQVEHLTHADAPLPRPAPAEAPVPAGNAPAWSSTAVWGAALTAISLPLPLLLLLLVDQRGPQLPGWQFLLLIANIGLLGLAGTILGWIALSDIRAHPGQRRGLALAVFAAMSWPLLIPAAFTTVFPYLLLRRGGGPGTGLPLAALFGLLLPVGMLILAVWVVHAVLRWAGHGTDLRRRGPLKWVFLLVLPVSLLAFVWLLGPPRGRPATGPAEAMRMASRVATPLPAYATGTTPWLRLTFTAVELREAGGARWLAIDYVDDVHGECEWAFPWETTIPGFNGDVRTSAFLKEDMDSPPVTHRRVEYRMPDSMERSRLELFRAALETALRQTSFRLELEEKRLLFELPGPDGGSLKAWAHAAPLMASSASPPAEGSVTSPEAAEIRIRIARDQLDLARQRQAAGLIGEEQVTEAELQLAIAEARGDAVVAARAQLAFTQSALAIIRRKFEVGVVTSQELRAAENRRDLAEAELKAAVQRSTAARR